MEYFKTGNGKLYHACCLDFMPSIPDLSTDMILCDMPYGNTHLPWDKKLSLEDVWAEYRRIIKNNGAIVLLAQQPFATDVINCARDIFRYELIWEKTMPVGFLNAKRMPMRAHENILVFYKALPVYNPQKTKGAPYNREKTRLHQQKRGGQSVYGIAETYEGKQINHGDRYPRSVLTFSNSNHGSKHHTQKPLSLFDWLVRTYTNKGDCVLDNCMGSGTTALACENTDRSWLGIEIEERYCEVAKKRLHDAGIELSRKENST